MQNATVDDMAAIHADRVSLPSQLFIEHLADYAPADATSESALATLRGWDRRMERDSTGATIYIATRDQLLRGFMDLPNVAAMKVNPFEDEPPLMTAAGFMWWVVPGLMYANDTDLLPAGETWHDRVAAAFEAAVERLTRELGDEQSHWTWGRLHRTNPSHPLVLAVPELRETLNPPSVSMGGDGDTPQAAAILPGSSFNVAGTSVTRYIFDVADWDNSRWIVPLGSSGHPGSPHFADQAERWSNVDYIPMTYSWDKVAGVAVSRMLIEPEE
jgi:penicillin amidase